MGNWGYAPCDGDAPHDLESFLHAEATAPYLIKLFKKPLRKGSRKILSTSAVERVLEEQDVKRPGRSGKKVTRATLRSYQRKRMKALEALRKSKSPNDWIVTYDSSSDRWNRLGLVQILSEKNVGIPVSVVKKCLADLRFLAKDEGFIEAWSDPDLFRSALANMIHNVELVLETDADRQKAIKSKATGRRRPPRRRGARLIYEAFFRRREGERRWPGSLELKPIPQRRLPRRRRKGKKKRKKG